MYKVVTVNTKVNSQVFDRRKLSIVNKDVDERTPNKKEGVIT